MRYLYNDMALGPVQWLALLLPDPIAGNGFVLI